MCDVEARPRWTDERLDDLAASVGALRQDLNAFRGEVRADFRWLFGLPVTTLLSVVAIAIEVLVR